MNIGALRIARIAALAAEGDDTGATADVSRLIAAKELHPVLLGPLAAAGRQMEVGGALGGSTCSLHTPSKDDP